MPEVLACGVLYARLAHDRITSTDAFPFASLNFHGDGERGTPVRYIFLTAER